MHGLTTPLPEKDQQTAALEQEIHRRNNPEEISQRLSSRQEQTRKQAFGVFRSLVQTFTNQPSIIQRLIAGCREQWPKAGYVIAKDLFQKGHHDLACLIAEEAWRQTLQNTPNADELCDAASTTMRLGQKEATSQLTRMLVELSEKENGAVSHCISLAYSYARAGRTTEASIIWKRLRAAWPEDGVIKKAYVRFMRETSYSPAPEDGMATSPKPFDVHIEQAKLLVATSRQADVLRQCEASITASADNETLSSWMNMARVIVSQHRDLQTANRLWRIILRHAPQQAFSFMRFSSEYNVIGSNPEVDALIRYAHSICHDFAKPQNKGKRIELKSTSVNIEALDETITIDTVPQTAHQWLTQAGQSITAKDVASAFHIWIPLLQQDPRLMPAVTRGLVRIITELSSDHVLPELRMHEVIQSVSVAVNLYRSVAANVYDIAPDITEKILYTLHEIKSEDPGNCLTLANFLLKQNKYKEAAELWLPLRESHAQACARCASDLAQHREHALAKNLYAEVAKVSPAALVRHGYEYFQDPNMGQFVLDAIEPILPTGNEKPVEQFQIFALKLFLRHSTQVQRAQTILSRLVASKAMTPRQAERLLSTPAISQSQQILEQRDAEMEEYLMKQMPDLQRGQFFRRLSQTKPLLKPGKRTDRTARSVLLHPQRLYTPDSPDPKNRRKKK